MLREETTTGIKRQWEIRDGSEGRGQCGIRKERRIRDGFRVLSRLRAQHFSLSTFLFLKCLRPDGGL